MQQFLGAFSAMGAVIACLGHLGRFAAIPALTGGVAGLIYDRLTHRDYRHR